MTVIIVTVVTVTVVTVTVLTVTVVTVTVVIFVTVVIVIYYHLNTLTTNICDKLTSTRIGQYYRGAFLDFFFSFFSEDDKNFGQRYAFWPTIDCFFIWIRRVFTDFWPAQDLFGLRLLRLDITWRVWRMGRQKDPTIKLGSNNTWVQQPWI